MRWIRRIIEDILKEIRKQYHIWLKYYLLSRTLASLRKKLKEHNCSFFYVMTPTKSNIRGLTAFERQRLKQWIFNFNHISLEDARIIRQIYSEDVSEEYIKSLYDGAKAIRDGKYRKLVDCQSDYVNIIGGIRLTVGQPEKWHNRIHLYGGCTMRGTGVEDAHTVASFLQQAVNEAYPQCYQVVNHGIGRGSNIADDIHCIRNTVLYEGDTLILCTRAHNVIKLLLWLRGFPQYDSSRCFHRPHTYGEWFTDYTAHTTKTGNRVIADYFMQILRKRKLLHSGDGAPALIGCLEPDEVSFSSLPMEQFEAYRAYLQSSRRDESGNNGAIVMNCNPFTLGHRYLCETAARQVDTLYLFVVEEDKPFFPFQDRLRLVEEGTKDLPNVKVLRSGSFVISALTFPGYFYRDDNSDAIVDTSMDINFFATQIAPILNITIRFAGQEPLDPVTRQYNEMMRERLPVYGIRFCEIARKQVQQAPITATNVRAFLREQNWEAISHLVPASTYDYLLRNYKRRNSEQQ